MNDFLIAVVLFAGMLYGIFFVKKHVVLYRKARKERFINIHKELYSEYDVEVDGFRLRFHAKHPETAKQQFYVQVYPVIRQVFELRSSETDKTELHYQTFTTVQNNTLIIALPAEADMDLFLEPIIAKSMIPTAERDMREKLVDWHTGFIEKHKVDEKSMYRELQRYEYRYRINLLNVPHQPWFEQEYLERTEWLTFPGEPTVTNMNTGV